MTPAVKKFVLHWGEMGTRWGVNRTVAQIHALLLMSEHPLPADEISEELALARSSVSIGLKELLGWGLVKVVHVLGDRRDHFEARGDVWEIFLQVLSERKRREIDPTLGVLKECREELQAGNGDVHAARRLEELLQFLELLDSWYSEMRSLSRDTVFKVLRLGAGIQKLVRGKSK